MHIERKPYRTPLPPRYKEPELPDVLEDSDWIYRDFGKSLAKHRKELPPRDDIIEFNEERDLAKLEQNIKLRLYTLPNEPDLTRVQRSLSSLLESVNRTRTIGGSSCI